MEVVRLLLQEGADTDRADSNGSTALTTASLNGYIEVVANAVGGRRRQKLARRQWHETSRDGLGGRSCRNRALAEGQDGVS